MKLDLRCTTFFYVHNVNNMVKTFHFIFSFWRKYMNILYGNQVEAVQSSQQIFYLHAVHFVSSIKLNRCVTSHDSKNQSLTNCQNSKYIIYIASL